MRCARPMACVPTNYRGTWICEICGTLCEAPPLPAAALQTTPLAGGGTVTLFAEPARAEAARPLMLVPTAEHIVLRMTNAPGETAEEAAMAWLIQRPAGYDIDLFGGLLTLCGLGRGRFAVGWEEHGPDCEEIYTDAQTAVRRFLQLRQERQIGLDFEKPTE